MQVITGYVRWTDGKHPVARVEVDTTELGIVSYRIPYGQSVGFAIDNSEFRTAAHTFRVDGRHLLAVVREDRLKISRKRPHAPMAELEND